MSLMRIRLTIIILFLFSTFYSFGQNDSVFKSKIETFKIQTQITNDTLFLKQIEADLQVN